MAKKKTQQDKFKGVKIGDAISITSSELGSNNENWEMYRDQALKKAKDLKCEISAEQDGSSIKVTFYKK